MRSDNSPEIALKVERSRHKTSDLRRTRFYRLALTVGVQLPAIVATGV